MTTEYQPSAEKIHLGYIHALLDDFVRTGRYVELTPDNFRTHSIEFTRLLLEAGSEIDVLAKMACDQVTYEWKNPKYITINDWREGLVKHYPNFAGGMVVLTRMSHFRLLPWKVWDTATLDKNPEWWTAYNQVKHKRNEHFRDGNMANALYALAGLYSITRLLFHTSRPIYPTLFI